MQPSFVARIFAKHASHLRFNVSNLYPICIATAGIRAHAGGAGKVRPVFNPAPARRAKTKQAIRRSERDDKIFFIVNVEKPKSPRTSLRNCRFCDAKKVGPVPTWEIGREALWRPTTQVSTGEC
jgi:hypothetical protein